MELHASSNFIATLGERWERGAHTSLPIQLLEISASKQRQIEMSYSLNSLRGGYRGDSMRVSQNQGYLSGVPIVSITVFLGLY